MAFSSLFRRLRRGRPIVVVSGLPRSGTSMMMRMLNAGGVPILTDGQRVADPSNPAGYYEFEPVKNLARDSNPAWLDQARGKAVKIVSPLLSWLPETHDYRVIFMRRELDEVTASQQEMLSRRGAAPGADDERVTEYYATHLDDIARFLSRRRCFSTLDVKYRDVIDQPAEEARRVAAFLGRDLDVGAMVAAVDPALYRQRKT